MCFLSGTGLIGAGAPVRASSHEESEFYSRTNALRASHGLPPLTIDFQLTEVARYWSAEMAAADRVSRNPDLDRQVTNWRRLGENVRRGPDVATIQAAFEADPRDAANLLDPEFSFVGIGVARTESELFVTLDFKQPDSAAEPPPAPAPVNPPPTRPPRDERPPRDGGPRGGAKPIPPAVASSTTMNLRGLTLLIPETDPDAVPTLAQVLDQPRVNRLPRRMGPERVDARANPALRVVAAALFIAAAAYTAMQIVRLRKTRLPAAPTSGRATAEL